MKPQSKTRATSRDAQKKHWSLSAHRCPPSAVLAVLLVFLAGLGAFYFYSDTIYSAVLGQKLLPEARASGTVVVEALNYGFTQPPQDFPVWLLGERVRRIVGSQEISDKQTGTLKFLSFESDLSSIALAGYYQDYLSQQGYQKVENLNKNSVQFFAQRGNVSLEVSIEPALIGSLASIYYRVTK